MHKKRMPDNLFKDFLARRFFRAYYSDDSYYLKEFTEPNLNLFYITDEQLEMCFKICEEGKLPALGFPVGRKEPKYKCIDFEDGGIQCINLLLGLLRDVNEDGIYNIDIFEYYMRCLHIFVNYNKYAVLKNDEFISVRRNQSCIMDTKLWRSGWYDDTYFSSLPIFFKDHFRGNDKYCKIVEDYIEKELIYFCGYEYAYCNGLTSDIYILSPWVQYFNFSEEFVKRNYKYFNLKDCVRNINYMTSEEKMRFMFGTVLENNINDIIKTHSLGVKNPEFKITPEKIDEIMLLYVANS